MKRSTNEQPLLLMSVLDHDTNIIHATELSPHARGETLCGRRWCAVAQARYGRDEYFVYRCGVDVRHTCIACIAEEP